jgi:pilus assembly protein TadC
MPETYIPHKKEEKSPDTRTIAKEKKHLKLFSFIKKRGTEKKEEKSSKPKMGIFAGLRRKKEEKFLDKKPGKNTFSHVKTKSNIFSLFKKKEAAKKEGVIESYKKKVKKQQQHRAIIQERRHKLMYYVEKAGLNIPLKALSKVIFNICVLINLVISFFLVYHYSTTLGYTYFSIFLGIALVWIVIFILILFILWVFFYIIVDLKIFKRKVDIEDVLPDYLQLTASNIKAGMTIDRALWYAVRPRFGVLAKEIEVVAKETMRGEDLKTALRKFADKYDSPLLKRSISLLIEGIDAGGEIGDLLNKIAINIQENKIMRKEMSANVTTYVIFISFATVVAAPVLFALAGILIRVIGSLGSTLGDGGLTAASSGFGISFSGTGIDFNDFRIFAVVSLIISSFFSSIIIATIKKGNAKFGLKYIPFFIVITITLFFAADFLLGKLIGTFL